MNMSCEYYFPSKKLTISHRFRSGQWGINCFIVFTGSIKNIDLKIWWQGKNKTFFVVFPLLAIQRQATDIHWKWLVAWRTATSGMNIELFVSLFLWVSTCCAELLSPSSSSSYTNTADLHMIPEPPTYFLAAVAYSPHLNLLCPCGCL